MNINSMLRTGQMLTSRANDLKHLSEGKVDKVIKKAVNRNMHKGLNSLLRAGSKLFK